MGRNLQMDNSGPALMNFLYKTVSKISSHHQLFEFTGSGSWNPQFPHRQLPHLLLIAVINGHHSFLPVCKSAVTDLLIIICQKFYRSSQQFTILLVYPYDIFMKSDQFLVFSSPGIGSPIIRVGKTAESCFVSIIDGRRSRPCHLDYHSLPEDGLVYILLGSFTSQIFYPSHFMIGSCKETGVIMIRQLIHGSHQRRRIETGHMIFHRADKTVTISQHALVKFITVFLHS